MTTEDASKKHEMDLRHDLDLTSEDLTSVDFCDDETRRDLLKKLTRIGASAVPVSAMLLNAEEARANTGSTTGGVVGG